MNRTVRVVGSALSRSAAPIAAELARRADVPFLSLTSGPFGLVAEVRSASSRGIDTAVTEFRGLHGVSGVDTLSYVEVVRDVIGPVGDVDTTIDTTDLALLSELQKDGRASYVDHAASVGLSRAPPAGGWSG